ncbi:hypothetical protein ACOXXX_20235 [Thalassococcus sp. BH17M4-6]|uniref:hypothetical protein n=1 Tax=Thalassococcus sp. BH17M4-6 TaxID=3413148 RepID=UPI003BBC9509
MAGQANHQTSAETSSRLPDRLLELLGGEIREEWRSAPSGAIYEVRIDSAGQSRLLGIVALGSGSSQGRVLELR